VAENVEEKLKKKVKEKLKREKDDTEKKRRKNVIDKFDLKIVGKKLKNLFPTIID